MSRLPLCREWIANHNQLRISKSLPLSLLQGHNSRLQAGETRSIRSTSSWLAPRLRSLAILPDEREGRLLARCKRAKSRWPTWAEESVRRKAGELLRQNTVNMRKALGRISWLLVIKFKCRGRCCWISSRCLKESRRRMSTPTKNMSHMWALVDNSCQKLQRKTN